MSFKVDDELLWLLEELARKKRTSKSELIRAALRAYMVGEAERRPVITKRIRIYG
ncbi:MAG: ribbon-helix-helix protein, CopG family [Desulfurococcales archaeon]|nr:ribbon-helix-helix protein, CopG family [Desulfurococcales archaeon]